jgi:hypothetical protein
MTANPPGALLAAALQQLVSDYPTDDDTDGQGSVVLTLTGPAAPGQGERYDIALQPGQVEWLTRLVTDEAATCRNAHSDGTGDCGHCAGTGSTNGAAR